VKGHPEGADTGSSRDLLHHLRKSMLPIFEWDRAADVLAKRIAGEQVMVRKAEKNRDRSFEQLLPVFLSDGLANFGQLLDPAAVGETVAFLRAQPGYAGHHRVSSDGVLRPFAELAAGQRYCAYSPETVLAAPHLLALANRPAVVDFVERAMGCVPTLYSVNAWWSFPVAGEPWPPNSQHFHRDDDDFRFFTFFAYLTDVNGLEDGPNQLLPGSQTKAGLEALIGAARGEGRLDAAGVADPWAAFGIQWPQPADLVERVFGPRVVSTCGPRGTSFLADTRALHRGHMPRASARLIFWARFGLGPNTNSSDTDLAAGPVGRKMLGSTVEETPRMRYVNRLLVKY